MSYLNSLKIPMSPTGAALQSTWNPISYSASPIAPPTPASPGPTSTGMQQMGADLMAGLGIASSVLGVISQNKQIEKQAKGIAAAASARNVAFGETQKLFDLEVNSAIQDILAQGRQVGAKTAMAIGEGVSDSARNALHADYTQKETKAKLQLESQRTQRLIGEREQLVQKYAQDVAQLKALKDSATSPFDLAMNIGTSLLSSYATFGVVPFGLGK